MALDNPMRPYRGRLVGIRDLATGIRLFQVELLDPEGRAAFADYKPGQFAFVSAFGAGEAPFGITSTPARGPYLEFAVNAIGHVTHTLHTLDAGDPVGVRGPLGNWFPMDRLRARTSSSWAAASAAHRCGRSSTPSWTTGRTTAT